MNFGRRRTDFPQQRFVTALFYYTMLSILAFMLVMVIKWQLETDHAEWEMTEVSVTSTPDNRSFFVPIKFCSGKFVEITLIRYYHDIDRDIYYGIPDGKYKTSNNGCFDTRIQANTGRLDPGNYEYHVSVSYELNPLRTIQRRVSLVQVTVE